MSFSESPASPATNRFDLPAARPSPDAARLIPEMLAYEYCALAVELEDDELTVAFDSPPSDVAIERIERASGYRVRAVPAPAEDIRKHLARVFGADRAVAATQRSDADAPAVRATDVIHRRAFYERASDIHIEPCSVGARVRFRVDGSLREASRFDEPLANAIVSRLKVLAGMDIAERRSPQDGRYTLDFSGHTLDARVSSIPTHNGEKLVVRLLGRSADISTIETLGMDESTERTFRHVIELSCGFVVVCGPTGSGKTTSLYAALAHLNTPERNLCTVEDPVEQALTGVTQVNVNAKAGITFPGSLRAILRQDPDVIMVGECRDTETANTAIAAALSGQLVFTTLHSADAPRTVERFIELGVSRSALAAGLTAVLAQRLVRRLCTNCRSSGALDRETSGQLGYEPGVHQFQAHGCDLCSGKGYHDRIGLFELIVVNDELREAIMRGASNVELGRLARTCGYRTMAEDGLDKCRYGITSPDEVRRVAVLVVGP